jgi:hypothetical protein
LFLELRVFGIQIGVDIATLSTVALAVKQACLGLATFAALLDGLPALALSGGTRIGKDKLNCH